MSKYLRYVIKNVEPVRIADDSSSQSGQTITLKYIPGTTIRGIVINTLAKMQNFESFKKDLFSDKVRYLNAYMMKNSRELLPSPKGFYEDKQTISGKKEIRNVTIDGKLPSKAGVAYKRAALGRYAYVEDDTVYYYSVDTGADMKINVDESKVFRSEYITKGHTFVGYIAVEDTEVMELIKGVFGDVIIVGGDRFAGLGKCKVLSCEWTDKIPYSEYMPQNDISNEAYMMLLSNTGMRNDEGELCGMDLPTLEQKLGVSNLKIAFCSTTVIEVKGYNRVWGVKIPSVNMYEQGSVFHLTYDGIMSVDAMKRICDSGIGVRKNEGFGRIMFMDKYEQIKYKHGGDEEAKESYKTTEMLTDEDNAVLMTVAKRYYEGILRNAIDTFVISKNPFDKIEKSNSQLGKIEAYTTKYKYAPEKGLEFFNNYLNHAMEKEIKNNSQTEKMKFSPINEIINMILGADLEEYLGISDNKNYVLGIPKRDLLDENEIIGLKFYLITQAIRYDSKEGA